MLDSFADQGVWRPVALVGETLDAVSQVGVDSGGRFRHGAWCCLFKFTVACCSFAVLVSSSFIGYGYEIRPGANAEKVKQESNTFLTEHKDDIDWLFSEFGNLTAAELELASTIIYVDREFSDDSQIARVASEVVTRVNEIKPHFGKERIQSTLESLRTKGIVSAA